MAYLERTFLDDFWVSVLYVTLTEDTITLLLPTVDAEEQGYGITSDINPCEVMAKQHWSAHFGSTCILQVGIIHDALAFHIASLY